MILTRFECPDCQWDTVLGAIPIRTIFCPICAADNGRDVAVRPAGPVTEATPRAEGPDARFPECTGISRW